MADDNPHIRKKEAFEAFLKTLEGGVIGHWYNIAQAIGVNKDTITAWKKLPEAQEAIKRSISTAMSGMERAGEKDWRMWHAKLKMLGIGFTDELVLEQSGQSAGRPLLPLLGGLTDEVVT